MKWFCVIVVALFVQSAFGEGVQQDNQDFETSMYQDAYKFVDECGSRDLSLCVKERALRLVETLPATIDIADMIRIKPAEGSEQRSARNYEPVILPEEPRAREAALDSALYQKFANFLSSHTLELKVPQEPEDSVEARKKKGGKKGMMPLMMLFSLKAATLGAIALKFIGLVAFKALLLAKIALTISSIIALKKLLESKHHTSTYEVVAHPHHEEHYDRSFNAAAGPGPATVTAQEMAYRGQIDNTRTQ